MPLSPHPLPSPSSASLSGALLGYLKQHPAWVTPLAALRAVGQRQLTQLQSLTLKALLLKGVLEEQQRPIVVLLSEPQQMLALQAALEGCFDSVAEANSVLHKHPLEFYNPYDQSTLPTAFVEQHHRFMHALAEEKAGIYLLTSKSLLMHFPTWEERCQAAIHLRTGQDLAPEALAVQLQERGYHPCDLVQEAGEYSLRGDRLDVFPVGATPLRLSFFGDTLEHLRCFDVETQRSSEVLSEALLFPRSPLHGSEAGRLALAAKLDAQLQQQSQTLQGQDLEGLVATLQTVQALLTQGGWLEGLDYYAPLVQAPQTSLASVFPESTLLVLDEWQELLQQWETLASRLETQRREGITKGRLLDLGLRSHATVSELQSLLNRCPRRVHLCFGSPTETLLAGQLQLPQQDPLQRFQADLPKAIEALKKYRNDGYRIVVCSDYPQRVLDVCKDAELPARYLGEGQWQSDSLLHADADVLITRHGFSDGLCLPALKLLYLTDAELFGRHRVRRSHQEGRGTQRAKADADVIQSLSELRPKDYVVHVKHGIGQFVELSQIVFEGERREYLTIQYRGNDRLFVPVDQLHLLSRYRGAGEAVPSLSKMGGQEWQKVTKKVKESIAEIAKELVALYRLRQNVPGHAFDPDTPWQVEMEEAFPFEETPDQWTAICDVKHDMESTKPMDRLVCGDVGFGKTEVAMRAAFKSVLSGKQAAVLVPTTILAQQHFNSFSQRLQPWGVRVGLMSRFRSPKELRELGVKLRDGEIDVLVGTHRILQKDVQFKDLGLLVIDEEHRFGVTHKERIKQLRTNVDVLTMSATPIPRTLYMSMSGVREMSLINTPPTNRLPVQTLVGPYNPAQLRKAILQELDRGGQIFYLHNRVQSIYSVAEQLSALVPEARIAVAHGQLAPTDLESIMLEFSNHAYDVLVSTTIIESGVDIPNANTLIVDDADRYGLAQLYQIRGRVGRSDVQAHAYFYYQPDKQLTDDAKQRLRAIREFTTLGSGYHIAMRDMEIRGVGNILGAQQHGHMIQIGFDLYCEMLNSAVEAAHENQDFNQQAEVEPCVIDLNITAFLPTEYVGSQEVKLTEYKRLARVQTPSQLARIEAEWQDRFGTMPPEAKQLLGLALLRVQATELGITLVRSDDEQLRLNVPYGLKEWMVLQPCLQSPLAAKLRWMAPVKGVSTAGAAALVYRHMGLGSTRLFQQVSQLLEELLTLTQGGASTPKVASPVESHGSLALPKAEAPATPEAAARQKLLAQSEARANARRKAMR